jgi:hypothetical protein
VELSEAVETDECYMIAGEKGQPLKVVFLKPKLGDSVGVFGAALL